jgi:nuclear transcription factor Y gamma
MTSDELKNHNLPLARVKKIMKSDEDVRMISAEAPVLFSKACELFILEITYRSWIHAEENRRRTLQRSDIATSISRTDIFDFLMDVVLNNEE